MGVDDEGSDEPNDPGTTWEEYLSVWLLILLEMERSLDGLSNYREKQFPVLPSEQNRLVTASLLTVNNNFCLEPSSKMSTAIKVQLMMKCKRK